MKINQILHPALCLMLLVTAVMPVLAEETKTGQAKQHGKSAKKGKKNNAAANKHKKHKGAKHKTEKTEATEQEINVEN